jgi:hypothetical protein
MTYKNIFSGKNNLKEVNRLTEIKNKNRVKCRRGKHSSRLKRK